jgi:hypothetical protein
MTTTNIEEARAARDAGMGNAATGAENAHPGWGETAYAYIMAYARRNQRFAGWMLTRDAALEKAVEPRTGKAWGIYFVKAQKEGFIVKDGFTQDPNRHANPCPVYKSLIYVAPTKTVNLSLIDRHTQP